MRSLIPPALVLAALLCLTPAHAQQAPSPAPPLSGAAGAAFDSALPIATPPGGTVQVELDLHDDDLLGVYKSFLHGFSQGASTSSPAPAAGVSRSDMASQITAALSSADLADVLKDVTHIHFVLIQLPGALGAPAVAPTSAARRAPLKPQVTLLAATSRPAPPTPAPSAPDLTPQYETAFAREGGHRIVYTNIDPVHLVMVSFGHAHGFALVAQVPGYLAALRSDGYPDLSKVSALATQIAATVGRAYTRGQVTLPPLGPSPK